MTSIHSRPGLFQEDLLPALQQLATFGESLVKRDIFKPAILVVLALYPLSPLFHGWSSATPTQAGQPPAILLLLAGIAYFGGFRTDTDGEESQTNLVTSLAEPLSAFQTVSKSVGSHFEVGFLIAIACYIPLYNGVPFQFQPWVYFALFATIATIGFFAPTTKFSGPLRFAYIDYSGYFAQIYKIRPRWWVIVAFFFLLAPTFLPFFGFGIISTLLTAWVYIYREYRARLQYFINEAAGQHSRATLAASSARECVTQAHKYEKEILSILAARRRDALLAESIKITDFFDCAAKAWAALDQVTEPARDVTRKAKDVVEAAIDVEDAEKPDEETGRTEELAKYLQETANAAVERAQGVEEQLKIAQEAVRASQRAREQDKRARSKAVADAREAAAAAKALAGKIAGSAAELFAGEEGANQVGRLADRAVAAATEGEMESAQSLVADAERAADDVIKRKNTLSSAMDSAHSILYEFLQ